MTTPAEQAGNHTHRLPVLLSGLGIAGGAVYHALVALAAAERGADLATRDARARSTYDAVGYRSSSPGERPEAG